MKRMIAGAILFTFSSLAAADWKVLSNTVYLNSENLGERAAIVIMGEVAVLSFPDTPQCVTFKDEMQSPKDGPPVKINGQLLKVKMRCWYENLVVVPATNAGNDYFQKVILSKKDIRINMPDDQEISFKNNGLNEAIKKLQSSSKAI